MKIAKTRAMAIGFFGFERQVNFALTGGGNY
jgi:hypothetical protein